MNTLRLNQCPLTRILTLTISFLTGLVPPALAQGPLAVSPTSGGQEALITQECPTFSWSDHAEAVAFRLEVYDHGTETLPTHDELAALAPPVLTQTIPAPAFTWTPSLPTCLTAGGRYLWYVQALDPDGQGPWSAPASFTVQAGLSAVLQAAVEEAVEHYLTEKDSTTTTASTAQPTSAPVLSQPRLGTTATTLAALAPLAFEGASNTFYGTGAGANTTGDNDGATFIGAYAGNQNTTGAGNTFVGRAAGYWNSTGFSNTFLGDAAGSSTMTGWNNTFVGRLAGSAHSTGSGNVFLGNEAGAANSTGAGNVLLGYNAGYNETGSDRLYIDNSGTATPLLYGQFDTDKLTVNGNLTVIGPDNGLLRLSNVTTDATTKVSRLVLTHYTTAQLPVYLFGAASTATNNFVALGGGNAMGNAATQLDFFTATTPTTPIGTPRLTIKGDGYVGIGTQTPTEPLQMAGGAYSDGTSWYTASSRSLKDEITPLPLAEALQTVQALAPVTFRYTSAPERLHAGFIAEDVPALVAASERKGLSPLEIVAVLTTVVQAQQRELEAQQRENEEQKQELEGYQHAIAEQEKKSEVQQQAITALAQRLQALEQGTPRRDTLAQVR